MIGLADAPVVSHTRTVWSSEAETMRSSCVDAIMCVRIGRVGQSVRRQIHVHAANRMEWSGTNNQSITDLGVEGGAHDVVVVARQHGDAGAGLPVPDADRLVVRRRHDPGVPVFILLIITESLVSLELG